MNELQSGRAAWAKATRVRISSVAWNVTEVRELHWKRFADLDIHRSVSVEARLIVATEKGDIHLGFVHGGPLSESGMNIELIEVRDQEGIVVADEDFKFSIVR